MGTATPHTHRYLYDNLIEDVTDLTELQALTHLYLQVRWVFFLCAY